LGGRKGIWPVKTEWWGAGVVICLERGADCLHMAQLMPLPLTASCFSKIQIGFTFLVPAHPGSPGQRTVKWLCVPEESILTFGGNQVSLQHSVVSVQGSHHAKNQLDSSCRFDIIPACNRRAEHPTTAYTMLT